MSTPLAIALLLFWCFLAWRSFQRGDMTMALVFLAVGIAITAFRLKSVKKTVA